MGEEAGPGLALPVYKEVVALLQTDYVTLGSSFTPSSCSGFFCLSVKWA